MRRAPVFFLLGILCVSPFLFSSVKGRIKGKIVDRESQPIEGVQVDIISVVYPSVRFQLKTRKNGEYIQIGLDPGSYRIRWEKEGFMMKEEQVKVSINETVEKNISLSAAEKYTKVEEAPGINEMGKAGKLYQEGKYEEALAAFQKAADLSPGDAVVHGNIGVLLLAMDKPDEAIAAFQRTIEIQPENYQALKNLGQLYGKKKDYGESVIFYSRATKISENDPDDFYNLGVGHMNLGDLNAAQEAFRKSIACDENYADSYYQISLILLNQNKTEEALSTMEKFLQVAPEDPKAPNVNEMIKLLKKK
jgi:tetratricopeptide (TPR) repeat protein